MAKTKNNHMYYLAGLDIGNGYVKGAIGANEVAAREHKSVFTTEQLPLDIVDVPSLATVLTRSTYLPTPDDQALAVTGVTAASARVAGNDTTADTDFFNSVMCTFNSPMVSRYDRHVIGSRALNAEGYIDDFAVTGSTESKADQSLSKVLVLALIAAKAVKDYVQANGMLPYELDNHLTVHVGAALALPITEYVAKRHEYAASFTGAGVTGAGNTGTEHITHSVTVVNFATPVTVNIVFDSVTVIAEGASAQYAISKYGVPLAQAMLDQVRARESVVGELVETDITAEDVFSATNTIGIDIGEGTVNMPVFTGGKFNTDASTTYVGGYGTVLEAALDDMASANIHTFTTRKQLAEFLLRPASSLKRRAQQQAQAYVDKQIEFFAEDVAAHFGKVLTTVGAATEVVYVYGGGSGPVMDALLPRLNAKVQQLSALGGFPVLYLDAQYSRGLNREGLYIAAKAVADKA